MMAFLVNMQKKVKQHGTRAGPTTLSDERARGAEMAGVWVWRGVCVDRENDEWGPTVIEAKMVKKLGSSQLARWGFEPGSVR